MKKWDEKLWLLTEEEFDQLPNGITLLSINNTFHNKSSELDRDTRFGVLAYGLTEDLIEKQGLENIVLLWKIRG
jgi:hypothetical protein